MKIAMHGLGKMGMQITRKLAEDGHEVLAHNRSPEPIEEAVSFGAAAAYEKADVIKAFEGEKLYLWLMLPADIIDMQLDDWLSQVPAGSVIIDGGNSDYRLTRERSERAARASVVLVDSGTSGGVWGYQNGFSMMLGGAEETIREVEPIFATLARPGGAYKHFGPSGAGHFVKMTHNAIEYGMMESLAEGYRVLKEGPYPGLDLAAAGEVWEHNSVIRSWLNELTKDALKENPELAGIDGFVAESGEARWTLETAKDLGIPLPAIQAAFDVRLASKEGERNFTTKLLAAMRNKFGGHDINKSR